MFIQSLDLGLDFVVLRRKEGVDNANLKADRFFQV